jgi:hypothetical protein
MHATAGQSPPSGPAWLHEIKHDGFRILARGETSPGSQSALILSGRCSLGIRVFGLADCIESLLHGQLIK